MRGVNDRSFVAKFLYFLRKVAECIEAKLTVKVIFYLWVKELSFFTSTKMFLLCP